MSHGLSVIRFAAAMEEKLTENDAKGGWQGCTLKWLLNRLRQETSELSNALDRASKSTKAKDADAVLSEAADVANFAMMLAENARDQIEANVAERDMRAKLAVENAAWAAEGQ